MQPVDCKRVAFVTVPLSGHIRPALAIAKEMAERQYAVDIIVDADGIKEDLLEMQASFPSVNVHGLVRGEETIDKIDWGHVSSSSGRLFGSKIALFEQFVKMTADSLDARVERTREVIETLKRLQPSVVVVDHSQMIAREWAQLQGIPTVILHTPYFLTGTPTGCASLDEEEQEKFMAFMQEHNPLAALSDVRTALDIEAADTANADVSDENDPVSTIPEGAANAPAAEGLGPHTFVFCEPELLNTNHVPDRVHVVGACFGVQSGGVDAHLLPWLDDAASQGQRVLYVALGTLANGFLTSSAIHMLFQCFASLPAEWRILWSLPEAQQMLVEKQDVPFNVRLESFVRQRAVLSHTAVQVFLTHGGQSSVNEGIAAGLPLVCMPLFCDQYEMAESVYRHGLGLIFHKDQLLDAQVETLTNMINRVVTDGRFCAMAQRYARLMKLRAGCGRAADVIESIVDAGADFQELWLGVADAASSAVQEKATPSLCTSPSRRGGA